MSNFNEFSNKPIVRTGILAAVIIFIMVFVAQAIGLGRVGFDSREILEQYFFYVGPGIGFLFGIFLLFLIEDAIKKDDDLYGNSIGFNSPGEVPGIFKFNWVKNWVQLTWLSIIFFGILGVYTAVTKQTFTGIGVLQHQFTLLDNILFSSALVPSSENLGAAFVYAFFLFLWRYTCRKYQISKTNFIIISVLIALLTFFFYGWFNHLLRYKGYDVAIQSVMIFWTIGGLITVLTNSFIPFWIMHISNNVFYTLGKSFSNTIVITWTIIVMIVLILLYILAYVKRRTPTYR